MAKREPLYPHVPKRRTKGTGAFECKECGYAAWNVLRCPKCGSFELKELSYEETQGKTVHPQEVYLG